MKNAQKKEVHLDFVIDEKYFKGKRGKCGYENIGFVVYSKPLKNFPTRCYGDPSIIMEVFESN